MSGVAAPAVMDEAERLGLQVVTEGAVVLGAPVGTDQFIADINKRVLQLTHDLAAVEPMTSTPSFASASTSDQSTCNDSLASRTDQVPSKASTTQSQRPSLTP